MENIYNQDRSRQRFLERFNTSGPGLHWALVSCWTLNTSRADGYAVFGDRTGFGDGELYAHRIVHSKIHGPIPDQYEVDHLCFTPNCANPLHLRAVPWPENRAQRAAQRRRSHCPTGHPYDGENTYTNPRTGKRHCRECMRVANRRLRVSESY